MSYPSIHPKLVASEITYTQSNHWKEAKMQGYYTQMHALETEISFSLIKKKKKKLKDKKNPFN